MKRATSDGRQAERFRATARQIATQLDIEAAMWQMLDQGPNDAPPPGDATGVRAAFGGHSGAIRPSFGSPESAQPVEEEQLEHEAFGEPGEGEV